MGGDILMPAQAWALFIIDGPQSNPLSAELYAPWTSKALCSMGMSRMECCEK